MIVIKDLATDAIIEQVEIGSMKILVVVKVIPPEERLAHLIQLFQPTLLLPPMMNFDQRKKLK